MKKQQQQHHLLLLSQLVCLCVCVRVHGADDLHVRTNSRGQKQLTGSLSLSRLSKKYFTDSPCDRTEQEFSVNSPQSITSSYSGSLMFSSWNHCRGAGPRACVHESRVSPFKAGCKPSGPAADTCCQVWFWCSHRHSVCLCVEVWT